MALTLQALWLAHCCHSMRAFRTHTCWLVAGAPPSSACFVPMFTSFPNTFPYNYGIDYSPYNCTDHCDRPRGTSSLYTPLVRATKGRGSSRPRGTSSLYTPLVSATKGRDSSRPRGTTSLYPLRVGDKSKGRGSSRPRGTSSSSPP